MQGRTRLMVMAALSGVLSIGVAGTVAGASASATATSTAKKKVVMPRADFNGDGYPDLAVGAPSTKVAGHTRAGAVVVTYGGKKGLEAKHRSTLTLASPGVPGDAGTSYGFGYKTAAGDLDGDGYTDLAVSATNDVVTVLWGGPKGLSGGTAIAQPVPPADGWRFGVGLAIGDFNGDRTAELAVARSDYGGDADQVWIYGHGVRRSGPVGVPYTRTMHGWDYSTPTGLSVGDLTGDGIADLVGTSILSDSPGNGTPGTLFAGSGKGLSEGRELPTGDSHAIGDVNGDGYADLVIGDAYGPGHVTIVYGSTKGLGKGRAKQVLDQASPGVPGAQGTYSESEDGFGRDVALGDVDGDGYADLAVGVPGEAIGSIERAGAVTVLRGSAKGITTKGAQSFQQNTAGIPGGSDKDDAFGWVVRLTDLNKDGKADLTVSAPTEDGKRGSVWSLRGTAKGLTTSGIVRFGPPDLGLPAGDVNLGLTLRG